jgi:hypothetical protein
MKHALTSLLLLAAPCLCAQVYTGLIGMQSSGIDRVLDVAYANNGDLIVEGCFNNSVVFGDTTLVADQFGDHFVGRIDANGDWLWARNVGGQQSYGGQLIVDDTGDIYAFLNFSRLVKLTGAGDVLWTFEQPNLQARSVALLNDEVLMVGAFNFTAIFGTDTFSTPNFYTDGFVGRLSAATGTWNKAWHMRGNGFSDAEMAWGVAGTPQGNILFTLEGESSEIHVGDDTLVAPSSADHMYVVEMDTAGHVNWWTSSAAGSAGPPRRILFTASGDPVLLGRFYNFTFDYEGTVYPPPVQNASDDAYVMWLGAGGALQDIVFLCGPGDQQGLDLEQDAAGNLYVAGVTCGLMTLGGTTLNDPAICNAFAAAMDPTGNWLWAVDLAGPGNSSGYGMAVSSAGTVCLGGYFATADVNAGAFSLANVGNDDGFIATLGPISTGLGGSSANDALAVFPNPARDRVNVVLPDASSGQMDLLDLSGRVLHSGHTAGNAVVVDLTALSAGSYVLRWHGNTGAVTTTRVLKE